MPSASFAGHAVTHGGNMPTQQRRGHATLATNMRCARGAVAGELMKLVLALGFGFWLLTAPAHAAAAAFYVATDGASGGGLDRQGPGIRSPAAERQVQGV